MGEEMMGAMDEPMMDPPMDEPMMEQMGM